MSNVIYRDNPENIFYPKRTDAVKAVYLDGTPESVRKIKKITGGQVTAEVGVLGTFVSVTVDGMKVDAGRVVVVGGTGGLQVLSPEDFEHSYSKDGY